MISQIDEFGRDICGLKASFKSVYMCVCVESFLQNMFLEGMCRD